MATRWGTTLLPIPSLYCTQKLYFYKPPLHGIGYPELFLHWITVGITEYRTFSTVRADKIAGYTDRLIHILPHIKIRPQPTLERRTQKPKPTTGKLVNDLDITTSPFRVGDSRYSTTQSTLLTHTSFTFIATCVLARRRLAFRNICGQSINSVQYTFPFHGLVYWR